MMQSSTAAGWAWVAGIIEGEGSFGSSPSAARPLYLRIVVRMTDRDVIEKLVRETGAGSALGPYKRAMPHWKDVYEWRIQDRRDVALILSMIDPWLCQRRRDRVREILADIAAYKSASHAS